MLFQNIPLMRIVMSKKQTKPYNEKVLKEGWLMHFTSHRRIVSFTRFYVLAYMQIKHIICPSCPSVPFIFRPLQLFNRSEPNVDGWFPRIGYLAFLILSWNTSLSVTGPLVLCCSPHVRLPPWLSHFLPIESTLFARKYDRHQPSGVRHHLLFFFACRQIKEIIILIGPLDLVCISMYVCVCLFVCGSFCEFYLWKQHANFRKILRTLSCAMSQHQSQELSLTTCWLRKACICMRFKCIDVFWDFSTL